MQHAAGSKRDPDAVVVVGCRDADEQFLCRAEFLGSRFAGEGVANDPVVWVGGEVGLELLSVDRGVQETTFAT